MRWSNRLKRRVSLIFASAIMLLAIPSMAQAVPVGSFATGGCNLYHVYILADVPESIEQYKARMNWLSNSCDVVATNTYYSEVAKWTQVYNSNFSNNWAKRYDSCTNYKGISISPATWATALKCIVITAAVPTSNALKIQLVNSKNQVMSHAPTSYIGVGATLIKDVANNWGGMECVEAKGISTTIQFQTNVSTTIRIPCKPPTALQGLRKFEVFSVWLSFGFTVYFLGMRFVKELKS